MNGLLCLKWNNHCSSILKFLSKLHMKEQHSDATIACHGKFYPVHKLVLSTCSEYFEDIFEHAKCRHPIIIVKDIETPELEAILNYMYKGDVNVSQELLPVLLKAAEALKIRGLAVPDDEPSKKPSSNESKRRNFSPNPKSKRRKNLENESNMVQEETYLSDYDTFNSNEGTDSQTSNMAEKIGTVLFDKGLNTIVKTEPEDLKVFSDDSISFNPCDAPLKGEEYGSSLIIPTYSHTDVNDEFPGGFEAEPPIHENLEPEKGKKLQNSTSKSSFHQSVEAAEPACVSVNSSTGTPYRVFQCPQCPHTCKLKSNMKQHIIGKHTNVRPLQCDMCPYRCLYRRDLRTHIMHRHTGEKPFHCPHCPYKAAQKQHIKTHMKTHTGERPFMCSYCPYSAAVKSNLKSHITTRHPDVIIDK